MRLPHDTHAATQWRIHAVAHDFRLEDVWALPTPGGPEDFHILVDNFTRGDPGKGGSAVVRGLFALRWKLGRLLGWDEPGAGLGERVTSLRDRLPDDLRDSATGIDVGTSPFVPLYWLPNEFAAEIANATVHGILHLGWVRQDDGTYRGQMAVLVRPNGPMGSAYLAAIKPLRHLIVYPQLLRQIERQWQRATTIA